MDPLTTLAIAQGVNSITGGVSNYFTGKQNLKASKEMANYNYGIWQKQFNAENARQNYLLSNQAKIQADAQRNAGFNPLWNNNQSQVAAVSNPSVTGGSVSGNNAMQTNVDPLTISQIAVNKSIEDLNRAAAEKARQDSQAQNIVNSRLGEMLQAQIDNTVANSNRLTEEAKKVIEETKNASLLGDKITAETGLTNKMFDLYCEEILKIKQEQYKVYWEKETIKKQFGYLDMMMQMQIAVGWSNKRLNDAHAREAVAHAGELIASAQRISNLMKLDDAQAQYFSSMAAQIDVNTDYTKWVNTLTENLGDAYMTESLKNGLLKNWFENMKNYSQSYGILAPLAGSTFEHVPGLPNPTQIGK